MLGADPVLTRQIILNPMYRAKRPTKLLKHLKALTELPRQMAMDIGIVLLNRPVIRTKAERAGERRALESRGPQDSIVTSVISRNFEILHHPRRPYLSQMKSYSTLALFTREKRHLRQEGQYGTFLRSLLCHLKSHSAIHLHRGHSHHFNPVYRTASHTRPL